MYRITEDNKFVVEDYNWETSFSNFFPGIAGKLGIPMWIYYVTRNQAICSMGVRDKNNPIMEFLSFNRALQVVGQQGFRTFIKINDDVYEPFKKTKDKNIKQKLIVSSAELELIETNRKLGLEFRILYYPMVNTFYPALVRRLKVINLDKKQKKIGLIDGLPRILTYGIDQSCIQVTARHIEGMMGVFNINDIPVFRLKQTPADTEEVGSIDGGNFYISFNKTERKVNHNKYIVDPQSVFTESEVYDFPWSLKFKSVKDILKQEQVKQNKTPCAFTGEEIILKGNNEYTLYSIVGNVNSDDKIKEVCSDAVKKGYLSKKRNENNKIVEMIKNYSLTISGDKKFDEYSKQTFLDNVIRGGMPEVFETAEGKTAFYAYSRQNGDLERDYHFFVVEPTYYSQGTGHYRSVNQNRRCDTWFFPEIEDRNIMSFINLIQTDGYNPLEVNQVTYSVKNRQAAEKFLKRKLKSKKAVDDSKKLISAPFAPGDFLMNLEKNGANIRQDYKNILQEFLSYCVENECGGIHEGFWVDHWLYNLDLIDNYLMIYPDKIEQLLLKNNKYYFYDDPDVVKPRSEKFVLTKNGVRQYNAVERDKKKIQIIQSRKTYPGRMRIKNGRGKVYYTNLLVKMLCMVTNRTATLDPEGIGIEMESDKPGWNDSMNGLPGIIGSSLCQTLELEKALKLLSDMCGKLINEKRYTVKVYEELYKFMTELDKSVIKRLKSKSKTSAFLYWDESHKIKEEYREKTRYGINGAEKTIDLETLKKIIDNYLVLISSIFRKENYSKIFNKDGVCYTYYQNEVLKYKLLNKTQQKSGYPLVRPLKFKHKPLPLFLEGPVHMMKVHKEFREKIYNAVRKSGIYDKKLNMYKVCESLDNAPFEIGRVKAWGSGWIENESVYTHMLYKYILEILRSGLYNEFYRDIKTMFMYNLKAETYGRSIYENVSFIVSSAFPDLKQHGRGLQPRLSGVTGEFINMWIYMVAGDKPFFMDENKKLCFRLKPILDKELFTKTKTDYSYYDPSGKRIKSALPKNSLGFRLFGNIMVIYYNKNSVSTYGKNGGQVCRYKLIYDDKTVDVKSNIVGMPYSKDIRAGLVKKIEAFIE